MEGFQQKGGLPSLPHRTPALSAHKACLRRGLTEVAESGVLGKAFSAYGEKAFYPFVRTISMLRRLRNQYRRLEGEIGPQLLDQFGV